MSLQIHLTRHGRSACLFPTQRITAGEFREWIALYNRTGIADDCAPSESLLAIARGVASVVCSDYPRSIESAARLVPNQRPIVSEAFREVGRPLQGHWKIRLPLPVWDRFSVLLWSWSFISGDESIHAARIRVQEATQKLESLARSDSSVLFVGHGMLNSMIGKELRHRGWQGPSRVNDEFWSTSSFLKPA